MTLDEYVRCLDLATAKQRETPGSVFNVHLVNGKVISDVVPGPKDATIATFSLPGSGNNPTTWWWVPLENIIALELSLPAA